MNRHFSQVSVVQGSPNGTSQIFSLSLPRLHSPCSWLSQASPGSSLGPMQPSPGTQYLSSGQPQNSEHCSSEMCSQAVGTPSKQAYFGIMRFSGVRTPSNHGASAESQGSAQMCSP